MLVPFSDGDPTFLRFAIGGILADAEAVRELVSAKGSASHRPCLKCANIVGRCLPREVVGHLVHFQEPDASRFIAHSKDSLNLLADSLRAARVGKTEREFKELEQASGLVFREGSILWRA